MSDTHVPAPMQLTPDLLHLATPALGLIQYVLRVVEAVPKASHLKHPNDPYLPLHVLERVRALCAKLPLDDSASNYESQKAILGLEAIRLHEEIYHSK